MTKRLAARSTPTSAGAFEYNMISPIVTNLALPTIISTLPGTNFTGAGGTVAFTNLISTKDYTGQPVGYQWQFDGTNIIDDGNYFGTTTNVLTVKHVSIFNQGQYTVVISPSIYEGALTSSVVELILTNPPAIAKEPVSITRPEGGIAEFTLGVVSPLNFEYQWKLNGTNLVGGSEYTGTNSNVLLIDPATTVDAGLYQVIVSNNYGARTSAVVRLTITADHARPTITITSPKLNNIRTNGPVLTGTAVDNAQVSNVFYWITNINAGLSPVTNVMSGIASLTTNGSTNYNGPITKLWSITNAILPGTNILVVQAVDPSSNVSTFLSRRFFYEVPSKLNLQDVQNGGQGSFTGHAFIKGDNAPSNNAALNVGEGYTLVAAPNTASLLGTWSNSFGTNIAMTNGNTLKFVMESNLTIVATFVSNMFTGIRGTYNGLFYAPPLFVSNQVTTNGVTNAIYTNEAVFNSSGMLNNLVLGTQGTFTAKLLLEGNSYSFSGAFNAYGGATNTIIRTAALGGPLTVALNANTNGVGVITGTVTNTAWPGRLRPPGLSGSQRARLVQLYAAHGAVAHRADQCPAWRQLRPDRCSRRNSHAPRRPGRWHNVHGGRPDIPVEQRARVPRLVRQDRPAHWLAEFDESVQHQHQQRTGLDQDAAEEPDRALSRWVHRLIVHGRLALDQPRRDYTAVVEHPSHFQFGPGPELHRRRQA